MSLDKRFITSVMIGVGFLIVLPLKIYAQSSMDINKNPAILMDKQIIETDRRILKAAQQSKASRAINSAQQKLQQDMHKMKMDKAALENTRKK